MKLQLVANWRKGWQWFSTWAFMLIVFLATQQILVALSIVSLKN
ncbi:hypothetical protein [Moraxella bovis]|nr:hypothetical protein [Moraxella bovis]